MAMADGTHSKVKLNVRVTPSKKQEWKDELEEGQTLSSLVQTAVDKELSDEYVPRQAIEDLETSADIEVDLSEVTDHLDGVNSRLNGLQQSVSGLQSQIDDLVTPGDQPEEEETSDLAMDLASHIPSFSEFDREIQESVDESDMDAEYAVKDVLTFIRQEDPEKFIDGRAQKFSKYVEADVPRVRQALIYLENKTTEDIGSVTIDGTRHWYRGIPT